MEAHIRSDMKAWKERRDAAQHRGKYGGNSTYSDWVIHPLNGHRVDEVQQVWANSLLDRLQTMLLRLSEKPEDPRQERKIINSLSRHRSILKEPPSNRVPSKLKRHGSGADLRTTHCQKCGVYHATHRNIEYVIAGDVMGDYLCDAYESGTMIELVDTLLDGTMKNLAEIRNRVRRAAERAGIAVPETDMQRDRCAACGSDDVIVKFWTLWGDGRLRFELAAFEQQGGIAEVIAPAEDPEKSRRTELAADGKLRRPNITALRLWGVVIAIVAFCVFAAELRYLDIRGIPAATGSLRGNWGILMLLGLPLVVLVCGMLQAISGIYIRDYFSAFSSQTIARKIAVTAAAVTIAITIVVLATLIQNFG